MKGAFLAVLMLAAVAAAQTSNPPPAAASATAPTQTGSDPLLLQLGQTSAAINASVGRLRIEKWKTGSDEKERFQDNADSIQRNIVAALPGMIANVRSAPASLGAGFKLYRNVSALYDVFVGLTQATGAFGPKDDFRELSQEAQQLDAVRRELADRLEQLAVAGDAALARYRAQQADATAAPKKIIIDDNEPAKTRRKKKSSKSH